MARKYVKKSVSAGKKAAEAVHAQLIEHVQTLVTSDAWPKLLKAMTETDGTELSRFSFNNMLLVLMQKPDASAVVTYDAWKARGRQVIQGQTSLRVYSPIKVKDPKDEDRTKVVGFRMIPEFDVSQTEPIWQDGCEPLFITQAVGRRRAVKRLQGNAPETMWDAVAEQITELGYTIERGNTGDLNGYTEPKTKIVKVSDQVSEAQAAKTLVHELGHIMADHVSDLDEYNEHRGQAECVAEGFAWMVCQYYGMDATSYSAPYISTWVGRDPEEIVTSVQKTGNIVLSLYRAFVKSVEAPEIEKTSTVAA